MKIRLLALLLTLLLPAPLLAEPQASAELAVKLLNRLDENSNAVVSPLSLQSAFAMTAAGTRGSTEQEIVDGLGLGTEYVEESQRLFQELAKDGAEIAIANRLWPAKGFKLLPAYLKLCAASFGAEPAPLDYSRSEAARKTINSWVSQATRAKIPELLPAGSIDPSTVLVLTNALYFKGSWSTAFPDEATEPLPFHHPKGLITVPMMRQKKAHAYLETEALQAVRLDYRNSSIAMTILVPKSSTGWKALRKQLKPALLQSLAKAEPSEQNIDLQLPRFKARHRLAVIPAMRSLGIEKAFGGGADFSRMTSQAGLFIAEAEHEAMIEVDEKGTVGAAATAVVTSRSMPRSGPRVVADRPFLFLVSDTNSGAVLFIGQVVDPERAH